MSAEALRAVMRHSTCRGPELMAQLAFAHLSKTRHGYYPRTTATQEALADAARMSLSRFKTVVASLIKNGRLFIAVKGKPNTYELPIREVLKADDSMVLESVPSNREELIAQNPCADSQAVRDPKILPISVVYQKPRRRRKA